jgi:hypothetical protein
MNIQPNWRAPSGWYPIRADTARCVYCKESLVKKHGLNKNRDGEPTVMGLFLFGVGPYCHHCGPKMWTDPEFFQRSGHVENSSTNYDLSRDFRPKGVWNADDEYRKAR